MATISSSNVKKGTTINEIKSVLLRAAGRERKLTNRFGQIVREANDQRLFEEAQDFANGIVAEVAGGNYGFASEIASTVQKYGKISEKQAYWIARTAWEQELASVFSGKEGSAHYLVNGELA